MEDLRREYRQEIASLGAKFEEQLHDLEHRLLHVGTEPPLVSQDQRELKKNATKTVGTRLKALEGLARALKCVDRKKSKGGNLVFNKCKWFLSDTSQLKRSFCIFVEVSSSSHLPGFPPSTIPGTIL